MPIENPSVKNHTRMSRISRLIIVSSFFEISPKMCNHIIEGWNIAKKSTIIGTTPKSDGCTVITRPVPAYFSGSVLA